MVVPVEAATVDDSAVPARFTGRALTWLITAGVAVVAADAGTKQLALSTLSGREPVRVLGGLVYLDVIRNSGAAFSVGTRFTWAFAVAAIAAVGWIGWLALRLRSVPWGLALGLIVGGIVGNLTDRIFRAPGVLVGHVVDYMSLFGPNAQYWPVFNVADATLLTGVGLAILLELRGLRRDGTRAGGTGGSDHN